MSCSRSSTRRKRRTWTWRPASINRSGIEATLRQGGTVGRPHIARLLVAKGYMDVATRVSVQLQLTDPDLKSRDRVVKRSEKDNLYAAMDVGCIWLERALSGK